MFYINYSDGFVAYNKLGMICYPTRFVRRAAPFVTFREADEFAKRNNLEPYVILQSALHVEKVSI